MQLLLVGVSHRTAPIELRERLDFSARGVDRALAALAPYRRPSRSDDPVHLQPRGAVCVPCRWGGRRERWRPSSSSWPRPRASRSPIYSWRSTATRTRVWTRCAHLFQVASGLDSMVLGEPQILGQVKARVLYLLARGGGHDGPLLNKLIHSASPSASGSEGRPALRRRRLDRFAAVSSPEDLGELKRRPRAGRRRRQNGQAGGGAPAGAGRRRRDRRRRPNSSARKLAELRRRGRGLGRRRRSSRRTSWSRGRAAAQPSARRPTAGHVLEAGRGRSFSSTSRCRATWIPS